MFVADRTTASTSLVGAAAVAWVEIFFYFWLVELGRVSGMAGIEKIYVQCELIEATNVVDTNGHGVSRQTSQMFASNCVFSEFAIRHISNLFSG